MHRPFRWSLGVCAVTMLASVGVQAQSPDVVVESSEQQTVEQDLSANGVVNPPDPTRTDYVERSSWYRPKAGWFVAGRADFGLVLARARLSLGWGHAHERWLGIEGNPIVSLGGLGAYGGIRFFLPYVDLRIGARFIRSFQRSYLEPQDEYDTFDFMVRADGKAQYTAVESELSYDIPVGRGALVGEVAYTAVLGVPDDRFVFEERIHIVLDPPHVWRARVGYGIRLKRRVEIRIVPTAEVVINRARNLRVWRGGFVVRMRLWDNLEVRLTMLPPLKTRDDFGIEAGNFGLGLRYRWAWLLGK